MEKLAKKIVGGRRYVVIIFAIILLGSACLSTLVNVNYDLSEYLPEDMNTKRAMSVMQAEFGITGSARLMKKGVTPEEAAALKRELAKTDGVESVVWLDDYSALSMLGVDTSAMSGAFYKDGCALYTIRFTESDYSLKTSGAIDSLLEAAGGDAFISGPAMNVKAMREGSGGDIARIILWFMPIFLIIMFLTMHSWFEPVLLVLTIGVSVVINMGTNAAMPSISFMTQMCMAVLQLAISMDYSIFLLHRFAEERATGKEAVPAMQTALARSFSTIMASCLTTVAGLVSIMFMRYRIGFDIGLVLAKGVIISLVCTLVLLPCLIILTYRLIEKTRHRPLLPSFSRFGKLTVKLRFVIVPIFILLLVPSFIGQQGLDFLYGESAIAVSEGSEALENTREIEAVFGISNQLVVIVPNGDTGTEKQLAYALMAVENVDSVQSLPLLIPDGVPEAYIPSGYKAEFESGRYARIILNLGVREECAESLRAVEDVKTITGGFYDDYYLLGASSSVSDIREAVSSDYATVTIILIALIMLILFFTFRSVSLPIVLTFIIEGAIFINLAIHYYAGTQMVFIGYMIVSSLQMGATIDYAILLTQRYIEARSEHGRKEAAMLSLRESGGSVLTSAAIFTAAGFTVWLVSTISGIAELGLLIGRGAALSGATVLIVLPQMLILLDRIIIRKKKSCKHAKDDV